MKICGDCGMIHRLGPSGNCIAKQEAKKKVGYSPDDRRQRQESESDRLARRWGVSAMQSGGSR